MDLQQLKDDFRYLNGVFRSERYKNIATTVSFHIMCSADLAYNRVHQRVDLADHNAGLAVLHQTALEGGTYP